MDFLKKLQKPYKRRYDRYGSNRIFVDLYFPRNYVNQMPVVVTCPALGLTIPAINIYKLTAKGVAVCNIHFRGGSIFSKTRGDLSQLTPETMAEDVAAVIDEIYSQHWAHRQKIYLYGMSHGCLAALAGAAQCPDRIAALFLCHPMLTPPEQGKDNIVDARKLSSKYLEHWKAFPLKETMESLPMPVMQFQEGKNMHTTMLREIGVE